MQQHVKLLAILHIALSGIAIAAAVVGLLAFGAIADFIGLDPRAESFAGLIAYGIVGLVLIISIPGLVAGVGLLSYEPWARILAIVISVIELPAFPLHTALGVYGLWVLLSNEGTALFHRPNVPARVEQRRN